MRISFKPPLCKGRWLCASTDGGVMTIPQSKILIFASPHYTREPLSVAMTKFTSKRDNGRTRRCLNMGTAAPRPCSSASACPLFTDRGSLRGFHELLFCSQLLFGICRYYTHIPPVLSTLFCTLRMPYELEFIVQLHQKLPPGGKLAKIFDF